MVWGLKFNPTAALAVTASVPVNFRGYDVDKTPLYPVTVQYSSDRQQIYVTLCETFSSTV